jgi:hypothetical protein
MFARERSQIRLVMAALLRCFSISCRRKVALFFPMLWICGSDGHLTAHSAHWQPLAAALAACFQASARLVRWWQWWVAACGELGAAAIEA